MARCHRRGAAVRADHPRSGPSAGPRSPPATRSPPSCNEAQDQQHPHRPAPITALCSPRSHCRSGRDLTLRKCDCSSEYPRPTFAITFGDAQKSTGTTWRAESAYEGRGCTSHPPTTAWARISHQGQASRPPHSREPPWQPPRAGLSTRQHSLRQPALDGASPVGCRRSRPFTYLPTIHTPVPKASSSTGTGRCAHD